MKRVGGLFDAVHAASTLAAAAWRAAQSKHDRREVRAFLERGAENLAQVGEELRSGRFRFGDYRSFQIRDPKTRTIRAPSFRDRVVHHALVAAAGAVFEKGAIHHSYACRRGKGQYPALAQAARWARDSAGFLKLDVAKYYDSVDHALLQAALRRRFREERLLALFDRLLASYTTAHGKGLPIGALTSQYLGNFNLDPFDHWVQQHGGVHRYLRYMDDMLFFGDLAALQELRCAAAERLALLGLRINHGGVLNRCALGIPWLGFTVYPDRLRLNPRGRRRLRRRLRSLEREWQRGRISEATLQARGTALFAHARQAGDLAWRRTVLRFSRLGEALELDQPRRAGRLLDQQGQELPLRQPQQEEAQEPEQEPGLPSLPAPRHGGADPPPDDAPSCALPVSAGRDETAGRTLAGAEIQEAASLEEKAPARAPPFEGAAP